MSPTAGPAGAKRSSRVSSQGRNLRSSGSRARKPRRRERSFDRTSCDHKEVRRVDTVQLQCCEEPNGTHKATRWFPLTHAFDRVDCWGTRAKFMQVSEERLPG